MKLSQRTALALEPNRLSQVVARMRRQEIIDLTLSNPTIAGFAYDAPAICSALAQPDLLRYEPSPFGLPAARRAVCEYYAAKGLTVAMERVVLVASTSEAYSLLLKLFADPGAEVLVPQPSYPLFDHLARLESVTLRPYPLRYEGAWRIDTEALLGAITPRTAAIFVVHPNNPTGNYLSAAELAVLRATGLPIVSDEVFSDYALGEVEVPSLVGEGEAPCVVLSGLSKVAGLPQVKLGWMVISGPPRARRALLERLEWMADSYLSVSTQAQVALPSLLGLAPDLRRQIHARVAENFRHLQSLTSSSSTAPATARAKAKAPFDLLSVQGGWYAMLRVPRRASDEQMVIDLLEQHKVLVHPGYFFDCTEEGVWVVSLLCPRAAFARGIEQVCAFFST